MHTLSYYDDDSIMRDSLKYNIKLINMEEKNGFATMLFTLHDNVELVCMVRLTEEDKRLQGEGWKNWIENDLANMIVKLGLNLGNKAYEITVKNKR